jgi:hypothetical protein
MTVWVYGMTVLVEGMTVWVMFIVEDHTVTMKCRTAKKAATLFEFVSMFCDCEMENSNKSSVP